MSGPGEGGTGVLLAHGAGAGQRHWFMVGLRRRLADSGLATLTFDYPYVEHARRAPDRMERLLACHLAAHGRLSDRVDRVVVAGKSMGGRVGGHLVADCGVATDRLVFLGYPLVALGKAEPRDTSHLERLDVPMLFIQGEKDRMGPPHLVRQVAGRVPYAEVVVVADADHGFRVPKRTGLDPEAVLDLLAATTLRFIGSSSAVRTWPS